MEKAQKALNIATGLNPTLDFAPASSVQSLKDAITPQTANGRITRKVSEKLTGVPLLANAKHGRSRRFMLMA